MAAPHITLSAVDYYGIGAIGRSSLVSCLVLPVIVATLVTRQLVADRLLNSRQSVANRFRHTLVIRWPLSPRLPQ